MMPQPSAVWQPAIRFRGNGISDSYQLSAISYQYRTRIRADG